MVKDIGGISVYICRRDLESSSQTQSDDTMQRVSNSLCEYERSPYNLELMLTHLKAAYRI